VRVCSSGSVARSANKVKNEKAKIFQLLSALDRTYCLLLTAPSAIPVTGSTGLQQRLELVQKLVSVVQEMFPEIPLEALLEPASSATARAPGARR